MDTLQTPTNCVCFLVTLAYFRATRKFFARQFYQGDLRDAAGLLGVEVADIDVTRYAKSLRPSSPGHGPGRHGLGAVRYPWRGRF